jgi:mannose-1-phosphate guanylyltransferase
MKHTSSPRANIHVVVLAGGVGKRFWPISTESRPKQFLPLLSQEPLIIETLKRLESSQDVQVQSVRILSNQRYRSWFEDHPYFQNPPFPTELIYEPEIKNTAPALIWVSHTCVHSDESAPILVLSSDHWIDPNTVFLHQVHRVVSDMAEHPDHLYVFGIPPTFASQEYGYVQCEPSGDGDIYPVVSFREKPDAPTAERFLRDRNMFWNAGIFVFYPQVLLDLAAVLAPDLVSCLPRGFSHDEMHQYWKHCPAISIDYAILEKTRLCRCMRAKFNWSDIGTWVGLQAWQKANGTFSPLNQPISGIHENCAFFATEPRKVVMLGCQDLIVVQNRDQILIADPRHLNEIKNWV